MRLSPGGSPAGALAPGGPRRLEAHGQPRLSTRWRGSSAGAAVLRMTTAADRAGRPLQASRKADLPSRRTSATPCPACLLSRSTVGAPSAGLAPTVSTMTALPRTRPTPPAPCSSTAPRRRWPATGRTITRCKRRIRSAARGRGERSIPSPAPMYAHWVGWLLTATGVTSQCSLCSDLAPGPLLTIRPDRRGHSPGSSLAVDSDLCPPAPHILRLMSVRDLVCAFGGLAFGLSAFRRCSRRSS